MQNLQNITQQINHCQEIIQQLVQQTQQSNNVYQQMLQQEQQNVTRLEELAQREKQTVQNLQNSMHGHQLAIQKMNQASQLCAQLDQIVRSVINNPMANQYGTNMQQQGQGYQTNPFQNQAQQFNQ
jgi:hypothetical protein